MNVQNKFIKKYHEVLGQKPSTKVIVRYVIDRAITQFSIKRREKAQRQKWNHDGEKKLVHITLYSVKNAGDNALSECIRILFEAFYGPIKWKLISLFEPIDDNYIQQVNLADGIIIGGHGAFLPDTNSNTISGWEWPCSEKDYYKITSPMIVFAIGYNYFPGQKRTNLFENNVKALVNCATFVGLRNNGSIKEIESFLGENHNRIYYQPCATMVARYLFPNLPQKRETHKIAINVALDRAEKRMGDKENIILSQIAHAMRIISERNYEIHFVTHRDHEIRFIQYLDREGFRYSYHHATAWDTERIVAFYNEMDMVIGMRGHGIWIPFGVNCHILALGNQNKTKWFFDDIGAPEWNIDIMNEPEHLCETIVEKFIEIHEIKREKTTERLVSAQKELWEITKANMQIMRFHLMGGADICSLKKK